MFKLMSECVDNLCHAENETLEGLISMKVWMDCGSETWDYTVSEYLLNYGGYIEHVLS